MGLVGNTGVVAGALRGAMGQLAAGGGAGGAPTTLGELAARDGASHMFLFASGDPWADSIGSDTLTPEGAAARIESNIGGCQGALDLTGATSDFATFDQSGDWGRDADRTWEIVFRFNGGAPGGSKCLFMLGLAYNTANMPIQLTSEYGGYGSSTKLRVQGPGWTDLFDGDGDLLLPGIDYSDATLDGKTFYLAVSFDSTTGEIQAWHKKTGDGGEATGGAVSVSALAASSGTAHLGGNQTNIVTMANLEIHHVAVFPSVISEPLRAERHTMLGL